MCARVAQWWSIALPRRGSRVRIPSRALKEIEKRVIRWMALFSMFKPCRARTVRMSPLRCGRRRRTSPGRSATSRALKEIEKRAIRWMALFSMFKPCRVRTVRMSPLRCGRRKRTSPGRSATSRVLKEIEKESSDGWLFFLCSSPAGFEQFECLRSAAVVASERPPDVLRRLVLYS